MVPHTALATLWSPGVRDDYGDFTFGNPVVVRATYRQGGSLKLTDDKGQEFSPKSTFWTRLEVVDGALDSDPKRGWLIALGSHPQVTDPSSVSAEQIRGVTRHDNSMFGQPINYTYGTT